MVGLEGLSCRSSAADVVYGSTLDRSWDTRLEQGTSAAACLVVLVVTSSAQFVQACSGSANCINVPVRHVPSTMYLSSKGRHGLHQPEAALGGHQVATVRF